MQTMCGIDNTSSDHQSDTYSTSAFPTRYSQYMQLRDRGITYRPTCTVQLYKNSVINRCPFEHIA